jgi:hypothetical protein
MCPWGHFNYYLGFQRYRSLEYPIIRSWLLKIIEDITCESCSALPATNQVEARGTSLCELYSYTPQQGLHSSWTPQKTHAWLGSIWSYSLHFLLPQQRFLVTMVGGHMVQDQSLMLRASDRRRSAEFVKAASYKHSIIAGLSNGWFVFGQRIARAWQESFGGKEGILVEAGR